MIGQKYALDLEDEMQPAANQDFLPIPVPLPTEIPAPPDLSSLPAHIIHSGTVETLIGQNEDLMARLKVNVRRNGILEQKLMEQERIAQELSRANNSLLSQMQILEEKELLVRDKTNLQNAKQETIREAIQLLETRLRASETKRNQLIKYQRRVRSWVRPLISNLKDNLFQQIAAGAKSESEMASKDATIGDLRSRMNATIVHCQELERKHSKDQTTLVTKYEERLELLDTQLEKARVELQRTRDRANRMDELSQKNSELENHIVLLTRQNQASEKISSTEFAALQEQVVQFRGEAKRLAFEIVEKQKQLSGFAQEREDFKRLQDQYESLQTVWNETQKKLDSVRVQNESLSRLNQELGKLIKEERKTQATATGTTPSSMAVPLKSNGASNQRNERIDSLLLEIESGFNQTPKPNNESAGPIERRKLDIFNE